MCYCCPHRLLYLLDLRRLEQGLGHWERIYGTAIRRRGEPLIDTVGMKGVITRKSAHDIPNSQKIHTDSALAIPSLLNRVRRKAVQYCCGQRSKESTK